MLWPVPILITTETGGPGVEAGSGASCEDIGGTVWVSASDFLACRSSNLHHFRGRQNGWVIVTAETSVKVLRALNSYWGEIKWSSRCGSGYCPDWFTGGWSTVQLEAGRFVLKVVVASK